MTSTARIVIPILLAAGFWTGAGATDITVRELPSGRTSSIPAAQVGQTLFASVPFFFTSIGYEWKWDVGARRLTCERNATRYVFIQDIPYYFRDNSLVSLDVPPQRLGPTLFMSMTSLLGIAKSAGVDEITWDPATRSLTIKMGAEGESDNDNPSVQPAPVPATSVVGGIRHIVIDPGHGGKDPGAIGPGGVQEKEVALGISLKLRDALKREGGCEVFLTRSTDEFVTLSERTKMANSRKADLFISIHANAVSGSVKDKQDAHGYKVFFLSEAKNEADKLIAMRENSVIELEEKPKRYGELKSVLTDIAGNEYLRESQDLSILLDRQFSTALGGRVRRLAEGVGQANFWVLNGAFMPSILIETGFISNRSEEKLLTDPAFQQSMAEAICSSVINFKKKYDRGL